MKVKRVPRKLRRACPLPDSLFCLSLREPPADLEASVVCAVCQGNRKTDPLSVGTAVTLSAFSDEEGAVITSIDTDKRQL